MAVSGLRNPRAGESWTVLTPTIWEARGFKTWLNTHFELWIIKNINVSTLELYENISLELICQIWSTLMSKHQPWSFEVELSQVKVKLCCKSFDCSSVISSSDLQHGSRINNKWQLSYLVSKWMSRQDGKSKLLSCYRLFVPNKNNLESFSLPNKS